MPMAFRSRKAEAGDLVIAFAIASLGAAALAMPGTVLRLTPPCLVSMLAGDHCWGCGITRAALAFLHGDFAAAWDFNKLSAVVVPMLLWIYCRYLRNMLRR